MWLPGGRREGHEYKSLNPVRADRKVGSFSINVNTGAWADFADDAKGGDLISLYCYLNGMSPMDAAIEVAGLVGVSVPEKSSKRAPAQAAPAVKKVLAPPPPPVEKWVPVLPVPDDAPPHPVAHPYRGIPNTKWRYKNADGQLLGIVGRFTNSEGGKEIIPLTFCRHEATGATDWRWVSFPDPRPLYIPALKFTENKTRLIVEGEKCADIAFEQLHDRFDAVTWPGGGKAASKADWSAFGEGDKVIIWPDCDSQRERLTPEEKAAGIERESKPILPEKKQPGMIAAEKIASILVERGCVVRIVKIPAPGEVADGWDIADSVLEGWDAEKIKAFVLDNLRAPHTENKSIPPAAPAGADDWKDNLYSKNGSWRECRENVYQVLHCHPNWRGCLWRDDFSNRIVVRKDTPTGLKAGEEWQEEDDFKLGLWLADNLSLFIKANVMISDGVKAAADANRFHPVKEWLESLVHDGTPRLRNWLTDYAGVAPSRYSELVGMYFMIGMVARIYRPGCKMDYMPIFEGVQGKGKSTILNALGGEWSADTPFVMGDKDSFMALRGKWLYEIGELDSFNRAEVTRAKVFISSSTDSYRAPYDRNAKDWPRQCVFFGTTNQTEYFKDSTGNRRYWPLLSLQAMNIPGLIVARPQLFAEAVAMFKAGEKWYPSKEEQDELFTPEQESREIGDPWMTSIFLWLDSHSFKEVSSLQVLTDALKVEVSKIDGARQMTTRVGICMRKLGWGKKRLTGGARDYVYTRPQVIKTVEDDDDIPF
ncbi:VapE domain-containing protein [Candidatus Nitrotoga sp. M5]|uniref:VapE domain-containing protein n=1 Tax=Candidatus Nitrotoga sp. M5 TaxID=2890409 RepID=UPI001EF55EBE|nr:VapE domain-containing protein [Candidatus Nitrotoga sp. M5]